MIGTVMCVIRYRRRARLRGLETAEVSVNLIFSLLKKFLRVVVVVEDYIGVSSLGL